MRTAQRVWRPAPDADLPDGAWKAHWLSEAIVRLWEEFDHPCTEAAVAEYDLGIIMREDPVELLHGDPMERARRLSPWTGRDPTAIWEWGVVERVSTGLLGTKVGLQPEARHMLETADRVALGR